MEVNRKGYGLGVVYTMDNEVIPRPCKICDWLLNSIHGHFGLQQGHNIRMTMEFKVPKRHILRPTLSIDIVQHVLRWERQKRCYGRRKASALGKEYCFYWQCFWRREDEDKRMVKILFILPNRPFGHLLKKSFTFISRCTVTPLGPHSAYTQWGAQRLCKLYFSRNWTMKNDHLP